LSCAQFLLHFCLSLGLLAKAWSLSFRPFVCVFCVILFLFCMSLVTTLVIVVLVVVVVTDGRLNERPLCEQY